MDTIITGNTLKVLVDSNLYSENVVYKCFYWYTKNFAVTIERSIDNRWVVQLEKHTDEIVDFTSAILKIKRDLIDFRLREIVLDETKNIRELLIAKAFANYDTDETPTSAISDPVGFDPNDI